MRASVTGVVAPLPLVAVIESRVGISKMRPWRMRLRGSGFELQPNRHFE
jgi:hypothetical protein